MLARDEMVRELARGHGAEDDNSHMSDDLIRKLGGLGKETSGDSLPWISAICIEVDRVCEWHGFFISFSAVAVNSRCIILLVDS